MPRQWGGLSRGEKAYIEHGIENDIRNDGRGCEDFRSIALDVGVIRQASGSARLRLGLTDVLVGVKVDIVAPEEERPDEGRMVFSVEMSPSASPEYEGRGGDELATELGRALERSFGGGSTGKGAALDLKGLCIQPGKTCWVLYVDALVLNADGNLLDALAITTRAALASTLVPSAEVSGEGEDAEIEIDDDPAECTRLDISRMPVVVTLTKVGSKYVVDATAEEERQMRAALMVAVNNDGAVVGVTKMGGGGLEPSVLREMTLVARRVGMELIASLDDHMHTIKEEA